MGGREGGSEYNSVMVVVTRGAMCCCYCCGARQVTLDDLVETRMLIMFSVFATVYFVVDNL